jgi:hypothetical protein
MSDQGERGVRWTDMSESEPDGRPQAPDPRRATGPQVVSSEPKVPEVFMAAPHGRTDFSDAEEEEPPHDIWGKVERRVPAPAPEAAEPEADAEDEPEAAYEDEPEARRPAYGAGSVYEDEAETARPAYGAGSAYGDEAETERPAHGAGAAYEDDAEAERPAYGAGSVYEDEAETARPAYGAGSAYEDEDDDAYGRGTSGELPDAEDVRVAPVPEQDQGQDGGRGAGGPEQPGWEGSLFEDGPGGRADETPAVQVGLAGPAKSGKPSSGNWQMPDWMADEAAADAKLGGSPARAGDVFDEGGGRSRTVLIGGVSLLVVALLAAGGVYYWTHRTDEAPADPAAKQGPAGAAGAAGQPGQPEEPQVTIPADKALKRFAGTPSRVVGRLTDAAAGLSYPRLAPPWQLPTKKNKLSTPGWSGQQIMVTERHGQQIWYGQLLTGTLPPTLVGSYKGPQSVKRTTALAAQGYESQYYAFPHKTLPLASQALNVGGHKGWLIASYLTYKRAGVRATGEIVATAVIDTGRRTPAAVFASLPNTDKKRWPDLNEFLGQLKVAA